jgi:hypothetical protein
MNPGRDHEAEKSVFIVARAQTQRVGATLGEPTLNVKNYIAECVALHYQIGASGNKRGKGS